MTLKKILKIIGAAFLMLVVVIVVTIGEVIVSPELGGLPFRSNMSPGDEYKIVLYSSPMPSVAMPGQGSDKPGFVRVYNASSGVLYCTLLNIPMVGQLDNHSVRWNGDTVAI